MEWYPKNPADYDRDTLGLTLAEHGAYNKLIDYYMMTEKPLPAGDRELAAICRCGRDEWLAVAEVVREFFVEKDGLLYHKRCDAELKKQAELSEVKREAGKKGGRPKKTNKKPTKEAHENHQLSKMEAPAFHKQSTEKPQTDRQTDRDIDSSLRSESPGPYPDDFERTWKEYPRRAGGNPKKSAFRAWQARLKEGHDPGNIIEGVKRYARFVRADDKEGTQFVMQAATFFGPEDPPHFTNDWRPPKKSRLGMAEPLPQGSYKLSAEQRARNERALASWGTNG